MALETATLIHQLDAANPAGPDRIANGDDHIRMIKACLKATFPNINGAVTASDEALNALAGLSVPVGVISLWHGTAALCPAGYAICDGTNGTPDLRGKVVAGASAAHLTGTSYGQDVKTVTSEVGGAHTHTGTTAIGGAHTHNVAIGGTALTLAQIPQHSHTIPSGAAGGTSGPAVETGTGSGSTTTTNAAGSGATHTHTGTAASGGEHTHDMALDAAAAHSHAVTVDVTQATAALHYIMKV